MLTLAQFDPSQSAHMSPLPMTTEEEEQDDYGSSYKLSNPTKRSKRGSAATSISELNEWFDASEGLNEGAEEFFLDETAGDGTEPATSRMLSNESRSSLGQFDASSVDTDMEGGDLKASKMTATEASSANTHGSIEVVRRTSLPSTVTGDEGSLFAILKKNVGKVYYTTP